MVHGGAENHTADSAETIDADFNAHAGLLLRVFGKSFVSRYQMHLG
jgi:hypothetical protein